MKFEVIPMMAMREMACMARTTVKVMPRAPKFCPAMMKVENELGCVVLEAYLKIGTIVDEKIGMFRVLGWIKRMLKRLLKCGEDWKIAKHVESIERK